MFPGASAHSLRGIHASLSAGLRGLNTELALSGKVGRFVKPESDTLHIFAQTHPMRPFNFLLKKNVGGG